MNLWRSFSRAAAAGLFLFAASALAPASADEIADEIRNALTLYEAGKVAEAKEALDFAAQLLGQRKADDLAAYLPKALAGWSAEDDDTSTGTMFGAGISAARTYTKDGRSVEVRVIGESPMLQAMSVMFANPAMAGASSARVQRIGGQRGIVTQDGDVQVMVGQFLIIVSGDAPQAAKLEYAGAVDYAALSKL
ncbi:MAG: hypothetical protein ACK4QW_08280 [Alphaproteobacteria bacterium]